MFHPDIDLVFQDGRHKGLEATRGYFCESAIAGWVTAEAPGTGERRLFDGAVDATGRRMFFEAVDFLFLESRLIREWRAMLDVESHVRKLGVTITATLDPIP